MFKNLRSRLLRKYVLIQGGLLVIVFLFLYIAYVWAAYNYQQEQVELFAFEESEEYWYIFRGDVKPLKEEIGQPYSTGDNFCFAYDKNGSLIDVHTPRSQFADGLVEFIGSDELEDGLVQLYFAPHNVGDKEFLPRVYMLIKRQVYDSSVLLGTICAGKDITAELYRVGRAGLFMLLLTIAAMGVIYRLSLIMVDEAMLPIVQALNRQKKFTADASHELRTPLSVLLASLECLRRDKKTVLSDFSQEVVVDMNAEIDHMRTLIENLLLLARADNNVQTAEPEVIDASGIVLEKCRSFSRLAEEKHLTWKIAGLDKAAPIIADSQQFGQLVGILLDNAVKYTPSGGSVVISLTRQAGVVELAVDDTGCGIESDEMTAIFKRFYRSDKARSFHGGTGLGLAIAQFLADANQIKISVESEPGQGSSFKLMMREYDIS